MNPLRIRAFFDGRLGHEKQTQGLLTALTRLTPVEIQRVDVPPRTMARLVRLWASLTTSGLTIKPPASPYTDLLIGTGTDTHLPLLLARRKEGGRVVTCMTPDILLKKRFDLCLVPSHDLQKPASNIFETLGPPNTAEPPQVPHQDKGLILVGGLDPKSHFWDSERVLTQIRTLVAASPERPWTISSSPRTPENTVNQLKALSEQEPTVRFLTAGETPRGWIEKAYAEHRDVWITADSVSMIYEALTAACRIGVLPVRWRKLDNKFQRSIDNLVTERRAITFTMWEQGAQMISGPPLSEAVRCAKEILHRWWPERLKSV